MSGRIDNLQKQLKKKNLGGLLISNYYNIFYLTGFKTLTKREREAWTLVTNSNTYILSDGRYVNNLKSQILNPKSKTKILKLLTPQRGLISYLQEIIKEEKLRTIGFEGEDLRVNELEKLREKIPQAEFVSTEKLIIKLRELKTKEEINKIKRACQIGDQCLKEIIPTIKLAQTEKEISFQIEYWLKAKGFNIAFPTLVAIDQNSAIPHYDTESNGQEKVKKNSLILIDFGVVFQNYLSDITRMIFFGKPKNEIVKIYNKLAEVQNKTVHCINTIEHLKQLDDCCRKLLIDGGLPTHPHSTGHGVGLEIHEYPKISSTSTDALKPNQVFTIEPGIYFPGKWGMRIEDTINIGKNLKPIVLTKFPKDLIIL